MARESTITFEQVSAAADSIETTGGKATSRAVRELLGSGSMATVLKLLQQRSTGQTRTSQAIDDTIDPSIARAISSQIAAKVHEATAATTAALAELQAETANIIAENEKQAVDLDNAATEIAAVTEHLSAMTGRAQQLEINATRTAAELVQERQAAELARINLAKAELRLEAVPHIESEIERLRAELHAERQRSAELDKKAAVSTAHFESVQAQLENQRSIAQEAIAEAKKSAAEAAELRGEIAAILSENKAR